ncbi:MAG TPA: hypothetical protein VMW87_02960 [Spirochaetia bacterium]|nr:hypothetical protein [Spirochaetia bacterium]
MATEIEIKAWARDPAAVRRELDKLCTFERSYLKKDIYLHGPAGRPHDSWAHWRQEGLSAGPDGTPTRPRDFRLRIEGGAATCTFKDRSLSAGIEINREEEFTVSDARLFLELSARLGCRVFSCKVKEGFRYWRAGEIPVVAELSHIAGLGDFIEVECVVDDNAGPTAPGREETFTALRRFLVLLGVDAGDIESTPYAKLLADRSERRCDGIEELDGIRFDE